MDFTAINFGRPRIPRRRAPAPARPGEGPRRRAVVDRAGWLIKPPYGHDDFTGWNTASTGSWRRTCATRNCGASRSTTSSRSPRATCWSRDNAGFDMGVITAACTASYIGTPEYSYLCSLQIAQDYHLPSLPAAGGRDGGRLRRLQAPRRDRGCRACALHRHPRWATPTRSTRARSPSAWHPHRPDRQAGTRRRACPGCPPRRPRSRMHHAGRFPCRHQCGCRAANAASTDSRARPHRAIAPARACPPASRPWVRRTTNSSAKPATSTRAQVTTTAFGDVLRPGVRQTVARRHQRSARFAGGRGEGVVAVVGSVPQSRASRWRASTSRMPRVRRHRASPFQAPPPPAEKRTMPLGGRRR